MNDNNEVYWEKKKPPEYPMFQELKEHRPSWDNVKQVFDVEKKYQRFYSGVLGNEVADKEQKQKSRAKESSTEEEEYFNILRLELKNGLGQDSEADGSQQSDLTCSCDKAKGITCQICSVKKRENSASNSPRNRSNNGTPKNKSSSLVSSPRNTGTGGSGTPFSKFKNT